jgi:hypothetical protein
MLEGAAGLEMETNGKKEEVYIGNSFGMQMPIKDGHCIVGSRANMWCVDPGLPLVVEL